MKSCKFRDFESNNWPGSPLCFSSAVVSLFVALSLSHHRFLAPKVECVPRNKWVRPLCPYLSKFVECNIKSSLSSNTMFYFLKYLSDFLSFLRYLFYSLCRSESSANFGLPATSFISLFCLLSEISISFLVLSLIYV